MNQTAVIANQKLEDVVVHELSNHFMEYDPRFKSFTEGEIETGKDIIRMQGQVQVNEKYKIRIMAGSFIGYGYDFNEYDDKNGESAKAVYDRAVKYTKEIGGSPCFETFIKEGVFEDRYGWYITQL